MPGENWHSVYGFGFGVLLIECKSCNRGVRSVSSTLATGCIRQYARRPSCALGLAPMLKKTLRANYRRKLAHVVVLADGTKLVTLRDAANVLLDVVNARSGGHSITRSGRC